MIARGVVFHLLIALTHGGWGDAGPVTYFGPLPIYAYAAMYPGLVARTLAGEKRPRCALARHRRESADGDSCAVHTLALRAAWPGLVRK